MIFENLTKDELIVELCEVTKLLKLAEDSKDYLEAYQYSKLVDDFKKRIRSLNEDELREQYYSERGIQ